MVREKDLLDILEQEEAKSRREDARDAVARALTPLEHVADILSGTARVTVPASGDIETAYTAGYFSADAIPDGKPDYLSRLLLAEAARSVLGTRYVVDQPLQSLAVRVAADIYGDLFSTLCAGTYLAGQKPRSPKKSASATPDEAATIDDYLLPIAPMLAAARYLRDVKGFEQAVLRSDTAGDLCAVAGAKAYYDLIPTKTGKSAIAIEAAHPATTPRSLFLYAIMTLHKEFFNHFEE